VTKVIELDDDSRNASYGKAYSGLQAVLNRFGNGQEGKYKYVYLCARINGIKKYEYWLDVDRDDWCAVYKGLGSLKENATSFEVEFLYDPKKRYFDSQKTQSMEQFAWEKKYAG
jgi:hypothetical protein